MPIAQASMILSRLSSNLTLRRAIKNGFATIGRPRRNWQCPNYNSVMVVVSRRMSFRPRLLPGVDSSSDPQQRLFPPSAFVYSMTAFWMASAVAAFVSYQSFKDTSTTWCLEDSDNRDKKNQMFRIEVDLMDKISKRPYLHPYNSYASWNFLGDDEFDDYESTETNALEDDDNNNNNLIVDEHHDKWTQRPPGVPHTLRILALDMPEMTRAFKGGACVVSQSHVYPSGVAPPKRCFAKAMVAGPNVDASTADAIRTDGKTSHANTKHEESQPREPVKNILATSAIRLEEEDESSPFAPTVELPNVEPPPSSIMTPPRLVQVNYRVEQKSVAKSMLRCYSPQTDQVSVQVLMGSIAQLNTNHAHPSKRRRSTHQHLRKGDTGSNSVSSISSRRTIQERETIRRIDQVNDVPEVYSKIKDELEAPWNQHAWMDELELRISGRVRFGEPMERASSLSRLLGRRNVYQQTIASSQNTLDWFVFPPLQTDPAGMDGKDWIKTNGHGSTNFEDDVASNWASQKPHAVVANGTALRQVPGSLRLLQRLCQQEQVPLFIYRDQHSWRGCFVYEDWNELICNLRQTIQQSVIRKALHYHQQGFLFASGRLLGQVEGEIRSRMRYRVQEFTSLLRWYLETDPSNKDMSKLGPREMDELIRERRLIQERLNLFPLVHTGKRYHPSVVEICRSYVAVHDAEAASRRRKWWLLPNKNDDDAKS